MASPRASSSSATRRRRRRRTGGAGGAMASVTAALALGAGAKAAASTSTSVASHHGAASLASAATARRAAVGPASIAGGRAAAAFAAAAPRQAPTNSDASRRRWQQQQQQHQCRSSLQRIPSPVVSSRKDAIEPLRMSTDSRELRFLAKMPAGADGAAAAPFLGGIETASEAAAAQFTSAAATTAVFSSSAFQREHTDAAGANDRRASEFFESTRQRLQETFSSSVGVGGGGSSFASSMTACFSTLTSTMTSTLSSSSASEISSEDNFPHHTVGSGSSDPLGGPTGPVIGETIDLSDEERELFKLLTQVVQETHLTSNLRVAGGWVRDKLLATDEFRRARLLEGEEDLDDHHLERLTSKFKMKHEGGLGAPGRQQPSAGRQGTKLVGRESKKKASDIPEGVIPKVDLRDNGAAATLLKPPPNADSDGDDDEAFLESHPVDIDVALDDMLGREFADALNAYLTNHGQSAAAVGVVLKNPEKSKHLETATMKVGDFWIDFVNLRAEEYTSDSRIPDLMRIGTAEEDAYRRDLTINALFYNINTGRVEDWTGRGFDDLRRGVVATPLPPLTTLLDDPLRVLRAVRFAARLRFAMDEDLRESARDGRVREALRQKVARERTGSEVDLMLRSPDPVGAMRLLIHLRLVDTVFPVDEAVPDEVIRASSFARGLTLLSATHDHLLDCKARPPIWCERKRAAAALSFGAEESTLVDDEESRRLLWYAAFLKPFRDITDGVRGFPGMDDVEAKAKRKGGRRQGKKANRSAVTRLLVDELKRPLRDAEAVEKMQRAADEFTALMDGGCDAISTAVLAGEVTVRFDRDEECGVEYFVDPNGDCYEVTCEMRRIEDDGLSAGGVPATINGDGVIDMDDLDFGRSSTKVVDSVTETDLLWKRAMAFRLLASKVLARVGPLWRAALVMSLSERLAKMYDDELSYAIEGDYMDQDYEEVRRATVARYDAFAAALQQLGLIGIWSQRPLIDGVEMKSEVLRDIPKGPVFRDIMNEQERWMTTHPGGGRDALVKHMRETFPKFVGEE
uniref:Poly A polymerase head domain-containing protein n=1 Tax=Odontella aurita TaxID=265563 RepID=A0A7S4J078_9STRA|mmetsp:Transcript_34269/g.102703  ORF Transcript_34269/g.102703 Transcript_34269/m.102703 type:complete len:1030 (+) Transcript_34269:1007-4096(+)